MNGKKTDKYNSEREDRIANEIIVDCYDEEEQKMSWYYYMYDNLSFPFIAEIPVKKRNGVKSNEHVEVIKLCGDEDFYEDMIVEVAFEDLLLDVPLLKLKNIKADEITKEAIEDWKYWNKR